MEKFKNYIIIALVIACTLLSIRACKDSEIIEVPVKIEVPVPVVEKQFDTIKEPYPVYIKADTIKLTEYINSPQDIQDSLYKEAITVREYNETFEDKYLIGNVYSNVTGTLNSQTFEYKTKERSVFLDTTITKKVPYTNKFFIGGEVGVPVLSGNLTEDLIRQNIRGEIGAGIDTKRIIIKGSISTDGYGALGLYYKF